MAFTLALVYANQYREQNPGTFTIYLEGGTYSFEFPGNPERPQLPSIRAQVVIQGNDAVLDLSCSLTLTLTESGKIVLGKTPKKGVKDFSYARWAGRRRDELKRVV